MPFFEKICFPGQISIIMLTKIIKRDGREVPFNVEKIAQAIYKAILSDKAQGVYNLGSHNLLSNEELAHKCVDTLKSSSKIVFNGQPDPMDEDVWDISLDRVKADTGYEPLVSIEEAILEQAEALRGQ